MDSSLGLYTEWERWGQRPVSGWSSPESLLSSHGFYPNVSMFGDQGADYGRIPSDYKLAMEVIHLDGRGANPSREER